MGDYLRDNYSKETNALCRVCKGKLKYVGPMKTMVGYDSPPGHDHDDNCQTKEYYCENGHSFAVSKLIRCPEKGCDWVGKTECFCHPGKKVDKWPEEDPKFIAP